MPDGSLAQPLTQIEFSYGRDAMLDTSGAIAVPHALASPDTLVMEEATFKATIDALTSKPTMDFFNSRKLNQNSKWSQTSMLMTNKFRTAGVLSILKKVQGISFCGPPTLKPIDNGIISLVDFPQAARIAEQDQFQIALSSWNRINNAVCDLLISSIQPDADSSVSLFPILNTNHILDLEHNVNVPASTIYEILSKHFISKMGTCEQIRTRCQTVRTRLTANCDVALVDSELRMLFLDFKFRDSNKRDLDEKEKIGYLANAFELHSDHRMKTCANQINHDCITGDDLTYEIAVNRFTSVEICINTQRMNAQLALTLANQYNIQNDHHLANSLEHEDRVAMIQSGRKRSRHLRPSFGEIYRERRRNEDPNAPARMNQYGYYCLNDNFIS